MIEDQAAKVARETAEVNNSLEEILVDVFGLNDKDAPIGQKAYSGLAIDVGMKLANMFIAIKNPKSHRTYTMACDLTYGLSLNDFWIKNASVLMPGIHIALNAYRDKAALQLETQVEGTYSEHDVLITGARCAPLEVFSLLLFCAGGADLMVVKSIELKQRLKPFLV